MHFSRFKITNGYINFIYLHRLVLLRSYAQRVWSRRRRLIALFVKPVNSKYDLPYYLYTELLKIKDVLVWIR